MLFKTILMDKTDVITTKISEEVTLTVKMVLKFFFLTPHDLNTLPMHYYCYCAHFLRIPRKKCATRRTNGLVLSPVSVGGSSNFLWKRCVVFNRWKIISIYLVSSLKTEEVCACCYFCRMIDLTEHFIVKQKSILKHQKLLLQDVTLGAWVLKNPLIGKDQ